MAYTYPPSKYILQYGEIEPEDHFYCTGQLFFTQDGVSCSVDCDFEVAYTHNCEIFAVVYLHRGFGQFGFNWRLVQWDYIEGHVVTTNRKVKCDLRSWLQMSHSPDEPSRFDLQGHKFEVFGDEADLESDGKNHFFNIAGFEFPELRKNAGVKRIEFSCFVNNKSHEIALNRLPHEIRFSNQTTSRLVVPSDLRQNNWLTTDVADLWCAVASLAVGHDIQWTSYRIPAGGRWERWEQRHLKAVKKLPYALLCKHCIGSATYVFRPENLERFKAIVKNIFDRIYANPQPDDVRLCVEIIRIYVDYCTVQTRVIEGKMRLITTLVEEFFQRWGQSHGLNKNKHYSGNLNNFFNNYVDKSTGKNCKLKKRTELLEESRNAIAHEGRLLAFSTDREREEKRPKFLTTFNLQPDELWHFEYRNAMSMIPLMAMSLLGYSGPLFDWTTNTDIMWHCKNDGNQS